METKVYLLQNQFGTSIINTYDKGNPLSVKICNIIITTTDKEPKLEKFNRESDPIIHLKGFDYTMELKCEINDNLKAKYFHMCLSGEAQKWFHSLVLGFITSYQQLKDHFKRYFTCNVKKLVDLINLIHKK